MASKRRRPSIENAAPGAAFLRCINAFPANPLLTGNGISAGFSVMVRLAYKIAGRAAGALRKSSGRTHA